MEFIKTKLEGCFLIRTKPQGDQRGYFVRTFCAREFVEHGLNPELAQSSYSFNRQAGTLRGLHFQASPKMEDKLVRCMRGSIFDVMVDIRPYSATFGQWVGYELSDSNHLQLHSVQGFAHGFQTLTDDCIVAYHIGEFYDADKTAGIRWDDPEIAINWPISPTDQSPRDLSLPFLSQINPAFLMPCGT
jgi:dTDP-4-dehydrorhamnose 3,5-epimerase